MDKTRIGIGSVNGYPFLSMDVRFALYKSVGFQSVMLWWGEGEKETRKERAELVRKHNLHIENVHADMARSNSIWLPGLTGDDDEHTFPLTGTVDWINTMSTIDRSPYSGCLLLETEYRGDENIEQLNEFLTFTLQSGYALAQL